LTEDVTESQRNEKWKNNQAKLFGRKLSDDDIRLPDVDWGTTRRGAEWIKLFDDMVAELVAMMAITRNPSSIFFAASEPLKHIADMSDIDFLSMTLSYRDVSDKMQDVRKELDILRADGFIEKIIDLIDNMLMLIDCAKMLHKRKGLWAN
jgi:hypothetical protein